MKVELLRVTERPEELIEEAGRTCYKSQVGDSTIIQRWIKSGHLSILEHASATFKIYEVSRTLTHQLVRHRTGKFSQQSQRYVSEEQFEYIIPNSIAEDEYLYGIYKESMKSLNDLYAHLVSKGVKKEDARFVLPNSCHTEIVCTFDFRNLRHFFELRLDKHSQWEIRKLANYMLSLVKPKAPNVFYDMEVSE